MTDAQAAGIVAAMGGVFLVIFILAIVVAILPFWKIYSKAGYSGALSLLMLVPLANLITLFVVAFSEWPIERELRELRGQR